MKDVPKRLNLNHYEIMIFTYYYLGYISDKIDDRFDNYMTGLLYIIKTYEAVYETLNYNTLRPKYDSMPEKEKLKISFEDWRKQQEEPYGSPPINPLDYRDYKIPDNVIQDSLNVPDDVKPIAFTNDAFKHPQKSIYYLNLLYKGLIDISLPHFVFPIIRLEEFIITKIIEVEKPSLYTTLLYSQYAEIYNLIGLDDLSQEYIKKYQELLPTETMFEIIQRENELFNKVNYSDLVGYKDHQIPYTPLNTGYEEYRIYTDICDISMKLHEYKYTTILANECVKLCKLRNDVVYQAKCNSILSSIYYYQGEYSKALELCQECQSNDSIVSSELMSLTFTIMTKAGKGQDCYRYLSSQIYKFENLLKDPECNGSFIHIDSIKSLFYLKTHCIINLLQLTYDMYITEKDYNLYFNSAIQMIDDCISYTKQINSHPDFILLLITQIQTLENFYKYKRLPQSILDTVSDYTEKLIDLINNQIEILKGLLNYEVPIDTDSPFIYYYVIIQYTIGKYLLSKSLNYSHQKEMSLLDPSFKIEDKSVVDKWFYEMDINNRDKSDFIPNIVEKTFELFTSLKIMSYKIPIYNSLSNIDLLKSKRLIQLLKGDYVNAWKEPIIEKPPEEVVEESNRKSKTSKSSPKKDNKAKAKTKPPAKKNTKPAKGKGKNEEEEEKVKHELPKEYTDLKQPSSQILKELIELYDKSRYDKDYDILESVTQDICNIVGYLDLNLFLECLIYCQNCKVRNYMLNKFVECSNVHNRESILINQYLYYREKQQHPSSYKIYKETIKYLELNSMAWQMTDINPNYSELIDIIPTEYLPLFIHYDNETEDIYFSSYKLISEDEKTIHIKRKILSVYLFYIRILINKNYKHYYLIWKIILRIYQKI